MKKFLLNSSLAWRPLFAIAVFCFRNEGNAKKLPSVVSDPIVAVASKLYPLPHSLRSDEDLDPAMKKLICNEILSANAFVRLNQYPYEEKSNWLFNSQLNDQKNNYRTTLIPSVAVYGRVVDVDETVFVCQTRITGIPFRIVYKYYVSSEYRLNAKPDDPNAGYVGLRFVFYDQTRTKGVISLYKIAETPADVYQFAPRFAHIENVYLDRRENFMPTLRRREDSLCQLRFEEKLRICLAVFNSSYFDGNKVEYPLPRIGRVEGTCELETVSFRTDSAKEEANTKKRKYEEWMMSCRPDSDSYRIQIFNYMLSSAYVDNEIWVYFRDPDTQQMIVETLATNVRISIDEQWVRKREPSKTDDDFEYRSE